MANTKTVVVSSNFPAAPQDIWPKLTKIETLQFIASPYASFASLDSDAPTEWHEGAVMRFRLRVFGLISMGIHTIHVEQFDKAVYTVQTFESNKFVPVWNHRITLEQTGSGITRYTDEVEIGADWRTNIIYCWSKLFYRHRQKRWLRLLP